MRPSPLVSLGDGHAAVVDLEGVGIGEARVGERVPRILVDGLLEIGDGLEHTLLAPLVPAEAALQVQRIRLEVVGVALRRRVGDVGQEGGAQRADDGAGDFVLNREHVVQRAIVALRPQGAPVVGGGELRRDAQPDARLPHRPLEHGRDPEQRADAADVRGFPFRANADVREAIRRPSTLVSALISSSLMPSLRYSFSGSALAFTNGSTAMERDRKSTRLNSSHSQISYAVFCLKKKKTKCSEL